VTAHLLTDYNFLARLMRNIEKRRNFRFLACFVQLGFNEADSVKFNLILIYSNTQQSIYTHRKGLMLRKFKKGI